MDAAEAEEQLELLWEVLREGDRATIEALLVGVRATHSCDDNAWRSRMGGLTLRPVRPAPTGRGASAAWMLC